MIARRRLTLPHWHVESPAWIRRVQRLTLLRPRFPEAQVSAERVAMRAETARRASAIRIDAERHFSGLPDR